LDCGRPHKSKSINDKAPHVLLFLHFFLVFGQLTTVNAVRLIGQEREGRSESESGWPKGCLINHRGTWTACREMDPNPKWEWESQSEFLCFRPGLLTFQVELSAPVKANPNLNPKHSNTRTPGVPKNKIYSFPIFDTLFAPLLCLAFK